MDKVYVWARDYDYEGYSDPEGAYKTLEGAQKAVLADAAGGKHADVKGKWSSNGMEFVARRPWSATYEIWELELED